MISIISGKYKGRKLHQLKQLNIRPTQAKVRKSIFQILAPFEGLEILDLYAGVGTLGIEALSRGAASVVFVEKNRRASKILYKNLELISSTNTQIILSDALQYVKYINKPSFDIVFADPPYSNIDYNDYLNKIARILKPGGVFCMEMKKQNIDTSDVRIEYYGNTQVVLWNEKR